MLLVPAFAALQGAPARAPAPPVPPLPDAPGQATGASGASGAPGASGASGASGAAGAAGAAGTTAPEAPANPQAVRDQIRDQISQGIRDGMQTEAVISQEPPYARNEDIPPEVIPIVGIVFGSIVAIVLGYPIVRLITRLFEKAADKSLLRASDVTRQLKTLQDSVDTMAIEIERISESQRFQDRLLSEREKDVVRLPAERTGDRS